MVKDSLVTKTQAQTLRELGFKEPVSGYVWEDESSGISFGYPEDNNHIHTCLSVPTTDEVIDWLRRKYNIIIYNKIEPFVDPIDDTHKTILFKYGVKLCDTHHLGWNGRTDLGATRLAKNVYSLKREAISIAIKYIKSRAK
jgi:hypothetical protein